MNLYETKIDQELVAWYRAIIQGETWLESASHGVQRKMQQLVPQKIQTAITEAVQGMTKMILEGSGLLTERVDTTGLGLAEREYLVLEKFKTYRKAATAQGIGFGLGGLVLNLGDLPALMSIKLKFMFEAAWLYGFEPEEPGERLYLLHVFQLAFSGKEHRFDTFRKLEKWADTEHPALDWEKFQLEYRDYLDVAKFLQILPVIGPVAGGSANHRLMERLRENLMNCYRCRLLNKKF